MRDNSTLRIGIVGTGMLGSAVALRLLESGFGVTVYNRTREKTVDLERENATIVGSPKKVAEDSDIVITIVRDADAVKHVSFSEHGIIHGRHDGLVVADMSTISPLESVKIAERFSKYGITMLDTPVMGGPNVAITGQLVLMAAGNKDAFERYSPVFDTIASKTFYLGKNGTAHAVKLAMNLQIAMLALSISEGITLARGIGIQPEIFLQILNSTYFRTGMSEKKAYKMIKDEFQPTFTLKNLKKDLKTINDTANSFGLQLPMSQMAETIYQKAIDDGFGDLDYTAILAFLKEYSRHKRLQN